MKPESKILCVLFLCCYSFVSVNAQETISPGGGNATGSGGSVSYTFGQLAYSTFTGTTGSVAEGVQQPYEISAAPVTQDITLTAGWNIFSCAVEPDNMSMMSIVQPLITAGTLVKIQDEKGNALEQLPPPIGWINNIGLMAVTEGYKIRVTAATSLSVTGQPVVLPYNIPFDAGWNIMGYPSVNSQAALTAFNPLITAGSLVKVQDELGNAIEQLPPPIGWIDNIHNLSPGEGYKVRTNIGTSLDINSTGKGESEYGKVAAAQLSHFNPSYTGNGLDHMNIYLMNPANAGNSLKAGDEIGVFDDNRCVGAAVVEDPALKYFMVRASLDDKDTPEKEGFMEGNLFDLRLWDNQMGSERIANNVEIAKGYSNRFEKLGTSVLAVEFEILTENILGNAYPNPSAGTTTFTFHLTGECKVRLEILNVMGELVKVLIDLNMPGGSHTVQWDNMSAEGSKAKAGIYFYRLRLNDFMQTKSLVIH